MLDKYRCLQTAEKHVLAGRTEQAIREYQKYLQQEGDDPAVLNTLGDLFLQAGRASQALNCFQRVVQAYTRRGFSAKAIALYKKIHSLDPWDVEVNRKLVDLYCKQGLGAEARDHLEHVIERCQAEGGSEEREIYQTLLAELDPQNPSRAAEGTFSEPGGVLLPDSGPGGKVEDSWPPPVQPLEDAPAQASLRDGVLAAEAGQAAGSPPEGPLEMGQDLSKSVSSLEEALQEADFYLKLGLHEDARELIHRLVRQFPSDERVRRRALKAMVPLPPLSHGGAPEPTSFDLELDAALDGLFCGVSAPREDEILRYDVASGAGKGKEDPKIHYDLGLAYKELGLLEDAVEQFLQAFEHLDAEEHAPQKILCCSMLANVFLSQDNYEESIKWSRIGLSLPGKRDFEWKALQYDLACALEKLGQREEAHREFQQILDRDPDYRDVQVRTETLAVQVHGK